MRMFLMIEGQEDVRWERYRLQAWIGSSTLDHTPRPAGTVDQVADTLLADLARELAA